MRSVSATVTIVFVLALAGCTAGRVEGTAQPLPDGTQGVTLDLSNFAFRPNLVKVEAGQRIMVTALSRSVSRHNVTIISAEGELFADVDVPSRETRTFDLTLPRSGTYEVYCDVGLHRPLGMEGLFIAR
jgi:plastocyanin